MTGSHVQADGLDAIVEAIYRCGAGLAPWTEALQAIAVAYHLWVVQFFSIDKRLGTVLFSHEGGHSKPEVAFDYFHRYHRMDPRAALVLGGPVGHWVACDEHFDDDYVASSPFYQQFLLPYGGRYVYGAKVAEDEAHVRILSFLRGRGQSQLNSREREEVRQLAGHVERAFRMRQEVDRNAGGRALGLAVLERMRQPLLVVDPERRIAFRNVAGQHLLTRGDLIVEREGFAVCRDGNSDLELMMALRDLALVPSSAVGGAGPIDRRALRIRRAGRNERVAATALALRPQNTMGTFGPMPLALLAIYEPGGEQPVDPFLLSTTFDLTPAEARVAAKLLAGLSAKEIARESDVAVSTVRTQIKALFEKTATNRQSELVRVLLLAGEF